MWQRPIKMDRRAAGGMRSWAPGGMRSRAAGGLAVALVVGLVGGCTDGRERIAYSGNAPSAGPSPWTSQPVRSDPNEFHFVIMADRVGGARPGVFEDAVQKVNLLQPDFVICVGDLIEGYSEDTAEIDGMWREFEQMVGRLEMPFCFVGGNHDLTNLKMRAEWERRFGPTYHAFVYRDVLFICLCTENGPADQGISDAQVEWLKATLRAHASVRWTMVFMHKPAWTDELRGPLGWERVTAALGDRPYSAFAGHNHEYGKYVRDGRTLIHLATTGGASEVKGPEFGQFDHVVWVTMTKQGPRIANLALSGVFGDDVVSPEMTQLLAKLSGETWAAVQLRGVQGDRFAGGSVAVQLKNETAFPMHIRGTCRPHEQVQLERKDLAADLKPGEKQEVSIPVTAAQPANVDAMQPIEIEFELAVEPPGRAPIKETSVRRAFADGVRPCAAAAGPIAVDGKLDDWGGGGGADRPAGSGAGGGANWIECRRPGFVQGDEAGWRGPDDCRFRFATAYDAERLYVAFESFDDQYVGSEKAKPWEQDGVYVHLDVRADPERSQGRADYGRRHEEFLFFVVCPGPAPKGYLAMEPDRYPPGTQVACHRTDRGVAAEFSIPMSYVKERQGGDWKAVRLNVGAVDFDPDQPGGVVWWMPRWSTPDNFAGSGTFARQ